MKRLMLMRHGAAGFPAARGGDRDRPLTARGVEESREMGRYLVRERWIPDLALCSTARRAVATWESVRAELGADIPSRALDALYLASTATLLAAVAALEAYIDSVILVNHNPAIGDFAQRLAAQSLGGLAAAGIFNFPTAALAVFDADVASWADFAGAKIDVRAIVAPDDL